MSWGRQFSLWAAVESPDRELLKQAKYCSCQSLGVTSHSGVMLGIALDFSMPQTKKQGSQVLSAARLYNCGCQKYDQSSNFVSGTFLVHNGGFYGCPKSYGLIKAFFSDSVLNKTTLGQFPVLSLLSPILPWEFPALQDWNTSPVEVYLK